MADIRTIWVERTQEAMYEIDVEKWFTEFAREWEDFLGPDDPTDQEIQEDFIKETAYELALEDSLNIGALKTYNLDSDFNVTIRKD